jgi:hypothetical protein
LGKLEYEPSLEWDRSKTGKKVCNPPPGAKVGDSREGRAGEVGKWGWKGRWLGVGGTSGTRPVKLSLSLPGVMIDRFEGFLLPVLIGERTGEKAFAEVRDSWMPEEVAGLVSMFILRDKFLTFRDPPEIKSTGAESTARASESAEAAWEAPDMWNDRSTVAAAILLNGVSGRAELGDSGEELGEGSVMEGESNVDTVVVGEESVESDETEETFCTWWYSAGREYKVWSSGLVTEVDNALFALVRAVVSILFTDIWVGKL